MKITRFLPTLIAASAWAFVAVPESHAVPIDYSFTGVAQGNLAGNGFGETSFEFNFIGDTANVVALPGNELVMYQFSSETVTVGTLGTYSLNAPMQVFDLGGIPGFGDRSEPGVFLAIGALGPSLLTYDMASDFGPVTGDTFANDGQSIPLVGGGTVSMYAFEPENTFQATTSSPVPDNCPAIGLFCIGLGAIAASGVLRRHAI
jgi:hypothetical protein